MEGSTSYADKVRGLIPATRFDPMIDEAGGYREQDVEMKQADAELTVQTVLTEQIPEVGNLHPIKASPGEKLPDGYSRSYAGFLLRDTNRVVSVNQDIVRQEMEYLATHAAIGCFVEGRPSQNEMPAWINSLQSKVRGQLILGRNLGKGFFVIKADSKDTVTNLLLATPYRGSKGLCIFQKWTPDFDPTSTQIGMGSRSNLHKNTKIPTWITLRQIPEEFQAVAMQIAEGIGELIGLDTYNDHS